VPPTPRFSAVFQSFPEPSASSLRPRVLIHIQDNGFPKATQGAVWNGLILTAEENTHHPVRDYLNGRNWGGEKRVTRLFLDYFPGEVPVPADDTEKAEWRRLEADGKFTPAARMTAYLEEIATCYMVSLVARVFKPGCKVDTLPVLISPEAFNKSQGFRALCLDEAWFTDDVSPDLVDRDTKDSLRGKWLIELAEFPHARRDATRFKMFASRQVDRFRRPYDRAPHDWPRQCGFAATANELELISVTGNRRVWPFWLDGPVDVAAIESDRDQLWAEAVHLYRTGYPWWLPPKIEAIASEMQDAFVEADDWDELIVAWIELTFGKPPEEGKPDQRKIHFTVRQVLEKALGYALVPNPMLRPVVATVSDEKRVIRRLQRLGYRPDPHRRRTALGRRFWVPLKK
jgi:predicted P-loop ATPase